MLLTNTDQLPLCLWMYTNANNVLWLLIEHMPVQTRGEHKEGGENSHGIIILHSLEVYYAKISSGAKLTSNVCLLWWAFVL